MSDLWPDPVPGAPCTALSLAQLALGHAAREVSDFARNMVPTGRDRIAYDGAVLDGARRLRDLTDRVLAAAVLVEREDGTGWDEIADTLHTTRTEAHHQWSPVVDQWHDQILRADTPRPTDQHEPDPPPTALLNPPEHLAHQLDDWVLRHREPLDPDHGPHPVTDTLHRMHPALELLHLRDQRNRLHHTQPTDTTALAVIAERAALLHDALATNPHNPAPEHTADAARARTHAAQLRAHAVPDPDEGIP